MTDLADAAAARPAIALPPLGRGFFRRPVVTVARALLGTLLVAESNGERAVCRIVETEAYAGPEDRASHARAGRTPRTAAMFGPAGHAYVYLVYGMHECLNVVAEDDGTAGAVLLRAGAPVSGIELMRRRRGRPSDPDSRLAAGPARLAQALGVTRADNGHDLTLGRRLWIARDEQADGELAVAAGPRVGVAYAGPGWAEQPWRFWLRDDAAVSRR